MNWLVAVVVTVLLWQADWSFALVVGIVIATLLGIEEAICGVQYHLNNLYSLLCSAEWASPEQRLPMDVTRNSFLGQKVLTPRTIMLRKLEKAARAQEEQSVMN